MNEMLMSVEIYETLKERLGSEESKKLPRYIDEKVTTELATKRDLEILGERLRGEIKLKK